MFFALLLDELTGCVLVAKPNQLESCDAQVLRGPWLPMSRLLAASSGVRCLKLSDPLLKQGGDHFGHRSPLPFGNQLRLEFQSGIDPHIELLELYGR